MEFRKKSNIAVILLNWNGKEDTLECLTSLEKQTYSHYKVFVVDNGSTDDSVAVIRATFPQVSIIESGKNLGYAGGNNLGIKQALQEGFQSVLLLNNDTVVDPELLAGFQAAHSLNAILGAKLYLYDQPDTFDHFGGIWNPYKACFDLIGRNEKEDHVSWENPIDMDYACGAAIFIPRIILETIGLLEERFFLIWEEADFCFRAKRNGFQVKLCTQAKVWHKVSASFSSGKAHSTYFWWRNRLLFIERNCSLEERKKIFKKVIFPEVFLHIAKLFLLKSLALPFSPPIKRKHKRAYLRKQRAALTGVRDYFLKRFGNAPKQFL